MNELGILSGKVKPPCPRCGKPDDGHFHDPPVKDYLPQFVLPKNCDHEEYNDAALCSRCCPCEDCGYIRWQEYEHDFGAMKGVDRAGRT